MDAKFRNCFDSHTHFLATGQVAHELKLNFLKNENEILTLHPKPFHYRGDWLVGFGWNHLNWENKNLPTKKSLDEVFPETPVFFSRVDGHCSWINSEAIRRFKKIGLNLSTEIKGGLAVKDEKNEPTGVLLDRFHIEALMKIPDYSEMQIESFLIQSGQIFNQAGFTHVRDLSMTFKQWILQKKLTEEKKLFIYSEGFITVENTQDFDRGYAEYLNCFNTPSNFLKIKGLKIFIDGSLGSETAALSQPYQSPLSKRGDSKNKGLLIWNQADIKKAIQYCWQKKIEIAIHCIGDEAVHVAALAAREVSAAGLLGKLHIEHAQIIRPETLQLLKPLHVQVHMQPCHWLSDQNWLSSKLGDLKKYLFPWQALIKNKIQIDFGSDSPIESPSLFSTYKALKESSNPNHSAYVPEILGEWCTYHENKQTQFGECLTEIKNDKISVYFDHVQII